MKIIGVVNENGCHKSGIVSMSVFNHIVNNERLVRTNWHPFSVDAKDDLSSMFVSGLVAIWKVKLKTK